MKKAGYILITVLEIFLLIGAFIVNYFTKKKMGMARYVVFKNRNWEREYPLDLLKNISVAVLMILTLIVVVLAIKRWKKVSRLQLRMFIVMIVLAVLSFTFILSGTTQTIRAYYFISPMLAVTLFLQILKTGVGMMAGVNKN